MKKELWLVLLAIFCMTAGLAQSNEQAKTGQQEVQVKIFPNPATSVINILGLKDTEKASIVVSDIYGNIVLQHEWKIKNHVINLPVANLGKGMYIITIQFQEQQVNKKFYKQ